MQYSTIKATNSATTSIPALSISNFKLDATGSRNTGHKGTLLTSTKTVPVRT